MHCRRPIILASAVAIAALSLLAAGCDASGDSPAIASVAASSTATAATSTTPSGAHANPLAFSRCMRSHGIADFPDPDSSGNINLKGLNPGSGSDLDPSNSRFQAAQKACKALRPTTFSPGSHPVGAQRQQDLAQALAFSKCMRAHGMPNFPDPDSNGRLSIQAIRSAGLGPASPQFQTATKACGQYQPGNIAFPSGGGA